MPCELPALWRPGSIHLSRENHATAEKRPPVRVESTTTKGHNPFQNVQLTLQSPSVPVDPEGSRAGVLGGR